MVEAGDALENPVSGQQLIVWNTARDTGGELLEVESIYTKPTTLRPPAHYHPRQKERFEVLHGKLNVLEGGQERTLEAGEVLTVAPGIPHQMWAAQAGARVNWQTRPALKAEAFFETIWGLAKDGKVNDKGVPNLLRVALIAREYEDVFRLASPPWAIQRLLFGSLAPNRYSARLPGRIPLLATRRRLAGVPGKRRGAIVGDLPDGGCGGSDHLCFPLRAGLAPSTWLLGRPNGFTTRPTRTPIHRRPYRDCLESIWRTVLAVNLTGIRRLERSK